MSLDDYFDRLDAAFASLTAPSRPEDGAADSPAGEGNAWPGSDAAAPVAPRAVQPAAADSGRAAPAPAKVMTPAEAFAVFLEAEQAHSKAPAAASPLGGGLLAPGVPSIDDLVDTVTRRVMDQLTGQSARESVSETVSAVAERLVREEIERLKASIK